MFNSTHDQVLLGTILGGSSLVKPPKGNHCYLSMRDGNEQWLLHKAHYLPTIFPQPRPRKYGSTYRLASPCLEDLTRLKAKLFDGNQRVISMDILDSFKADGLATWWLEAGSLTGRKRKNAYICTTKLRETGTAIVRRYFHEIDMPCNVNREGPRQKIVFSVKGSEKFIETIRPQIPDFMVHRLN